MNKRGSLFLGAIVALVVFMSGVLFIQFLQDTVTDARIDLDCSTPADITDGTKLLCLIIGGAIPYYIIAFISIAVGFIAEKIT